MTGNKRCLHRRVSRRDLHRIVLTLTATALLASAAHAGTVSVAVAANFIDAADEIRQAFAEATGHDATFSFGATGQLYAQITQGAPFEVFLAADQAHPARALEEGYGVEGTAFTYANGQLVLYSAEEDRVTGRATLEAGEFDRIAIANPRTAPYGRAAVETMRSLGVYEALRPRIVQGQSIGQTYQFVGTGNAELGFVALGQLARREGGSRWAVPREHHEPIDQDAVLLANGADNPAAAAFLTFLKGDEAVAIIAKYGYALDRRSDMN